MYDVKSFYQRKLFNCDKRELCMSLCRCANRLIIFVINWYNFYMLCKCIAYHDDLKTKTRSNPNTTCHRNFIEITSAWLYIFCMIFRLIHFTANPLFYNWLYSFALRLLSFLSLSSPFSHCLRAVLVRTQIYVEH